MKTILILWSVFFAVGCSCTAENDIIPWYTGFSCAETIKTYISSGKHKVGWLEVDIKRQDGSTFQARLYYPAQQSGRYHARVVKSKNWVL